MDGVWSALGNASPCVAIGVLLLAGFRYMTKTVIDTLRDEVKDLRDNQRQLQRDRREDQRRINTLESTLAQKGIKIPNGDH